MRLGYGIEGVFAGAEDEAFGVFAFFRQERQKGDCAEGGLQVGEDFFLTVGAVDHCERARRFEGECCGIDPQTQIPCFFGVGGAFDRIPRNIMRCFFVIGRVDERVVEQAVEIGRQLGNVAVANIEAGGEDITFDIAAAERGEIGLDFEAEADDSRDTAGEAEHRAPYPASHIENPVAREGRHCGGEQDCVYCYAIA